MPKPKRPSAQGPEDFIKERQYLKNVTQKTLAWYKQSFKAFQACEKEDQFKARVVALRERGVSPISVNTWLRCVNAYLKWSGAPYRLPKLQEPSKVLETLSQAQIALLRAARTTRTRNLALVALDTGLRVEELLTLTRSDVNLDQMTLRVTGKGRKERIVPISQEGRRILYRHTFRPTSRPWCSAPGMVAG